MKTLIKIDELRPIVNQINNVEITQGKATELITEVCAERLPNVLKLLATENAECKLQNAKLKILMREVLTHYDNFRLSNLHNLLKDENMKQSDLLQKVSELLTEYK